MVKTVRLPPCGSRWSGLQGAGCWVVYCLCRTSRLLRTGAASHLTLRRGLQVLLVRGEGDEEGAPGKWETVDQPDEPPTDLPLAGGALAKVKTDCVGVCGTDFHAFYGKQVRAAHRALSAPVFTLCARTGFLRVPSRDWPRAVRDVPRGSRRLPQPAERQGGRRMLGGAVPALRLLRRV